MKNIKAYCKEICGLIYVLDEYGNNIFTHSKINRSDIFEHLCKLGKYDLFHLYDDPEELKLWQKLVRLNRNLETKESF